MSARLASPQVKPRTDRRGCPWVFRYRADEGRPDGSTRTLRKYYEIGPSQGPAALSREEAEAARDRFLAEQNAASGERGPDIDARQMVAKESNRLLQAGSVFATAPDAACDSFAKAAQLYRDGYLNRDRQIARPTREKETFYLREYLIPRWGTHGLADIQARLLEDWLHTTFDSWWTMHGVRAIMNRVYHHAEGHGLWPEGRRNPAAKARLGRKRNKRERRILTFEETARVLARLEQPCRLIIQTCIATGARISEVLGLKWKHVDLKQPAIRIEQRVWHQEVGRVKSEYSRRVLGIGDLAPQFAGKALMDGAEAEAFVFQQKTRTGKPRGKPMWDSGIRDALHIAAQQEQCDFPGLGPHSFRRANITWRQEVGGSSIEASKIAGHNGLNVTGEYTFVSAERQNELTRRIQQKLANAGVRSPADRDGNPSGN